MHPEMRRHVSFRVVSTSLRCVERAQTGQQYTMVSGVDESVCGVNSVMSAGVLDLCGIDPVVSGVDEPVCGISSLMTAGELDVCGCGSLVSDGAGESSGVEVVDDVVACGDDKLLPDAFRVGGWLSVAGLGVAQPAWVEGIICADGSLRPEPQPMHSTCLRRMLLVAACSAGMTIVAMNSTGVQIAACCLREKAIASICQTNVTACQSEGCILVFVLTGV